MNTAKLTVLYKGRFRASDSKELINSASAWNLAITNQLPDFASHTLSTLKSKASFRRPFSAIGSATQIEPWALSEQPDGWGTSRAADPLAELDRHRAIGLMPISSRPPPPLSADCHSEPLSGFTCASCPVTEMSRISLTERGLDIFYETG